MKDIKTFIIGFLSVTCLLLMSCEENSSTKKSKNRLLLMESYENGTPFTAYEVNDEGESVKLNYYYNTGQVYISYEVSKLKEGGKLYLDGRFIKYYSNGNVKQTGMYELDKLNGEMLWFENGESAANRKKTFVYDDDTMSKVMMNTIGQSPEDAETPEEMDKNNEHF